MDKSYVKTVIDGLQSSSSTRVQETLLKLRSKVIADENGLQLFRDFGGLAFLVPHLRKPNERILDLSLSILGNCCLDEQTCLAAGKLNIFAPLITVLKTVCRDSIVGRACRVIGNLAQRPTNAEELHNHGAVSALITVIESRDKNTSYPTLTMAVRAIRQLWTVTEKREEMLSLNTVHCIATLLITECESAGILKSSNPQNELVELRNSQEELITGILKCLVYFTTHATSQCAEQVQGDGRGFQSLVALTKRFEPLAMKCLMNLCYLSTCRPLLGAAGMVECLVGMLQNNPVSRWGEGAARALAQLSGEAVTRARLRRCGGLALLLAAARLHAHAMRALLQYVFDDTSFQILVNEGLVTLLTDELMNYLTTMKLEHDYKDTTECDPYDSKSNDSTQDTSSSSNVDTNKSEEKTPLYQRRKGPLSKTSEDDLKVVIERDNMLVGFIDAIDSASDESASEEADSPRRRNLKRPRSTSPNNSIKKYRPRKKDWSASVYWEPKSPEWPSTSRGRSPQRGPLSPRSEGGGKRGRSDLSPESGFASADGQASPAWADYQWSPGSSVTNYDDSSDSEISGRYSPVCDEEAPPALEVDAAQEAFDELAVDDGEAADDGDPSEDLTEERLSVERASPRIACVLVLLSRATAGARGAEGAAGGGAGELLAGRDCLAALLDYAERCRRPAGRPARILTRLLSNALCLVNVLKHKFALRLHRMSVTSKHPVSKCQQCKEIKRLSVKLLAQLTVLAESGHGLGEISYQLLRGPPHVRRTLSLTLPYIVKAERALRKLCVEGRALDHLLQALAEDDDDFAHCVTAVAKIAATIHIKDPKDLENKFSERILVTYDPTLDNLAKEDVVVFELDDGSRVAADRAFLCERSEVFRAMLAGRFEEAAQASVRLRRVSARALRCLLALMQRGGLERGLARRAGPMDERLDTNLEVLLLADRFLLDKLKESLNSAIVQFQLSPSTADEIYSWSLGEGMGVLCVEAVAYLCAGRMSAAQRARAFRALLRPPLCAQWLDDIRALLLRQLDGPHSTEGTSTLK